MESVVFFHAGTSQVRWTKPRKKLKHHTDVPREGYGIKTNIKLFKVHYWPQEPVPNQMGTLDENSAR